MRHFFVDPTDITGTGAVISGSEARHIRLVLRLDPGQGIKLFDGMGNIYRAIIRNLDKAKITVSITDKKKFIDNGPQVHLGQALLKGKKMDFLVQKATELGIHTVHPFTSEHCAKRTSASRNERWKKISLEACKQSGRPLPLNCRPVQKFSNIIRQSTNFKCNIIFWEQEKKNILGNLPPTPDSILFLIGPEGGFSYKEVMEAHNHGFQPITFGKRILRAETAAFCAMSIIQYINGNLDYQITEGRNEGGNPADKPGRS